MPDNLHPKPNLDFLKRRAKEVLKGHREGNPDAVSWVRHLLPRLSGASEEAVRGETISLSEAQLVVARGHGFPSWVRLKRYIESIKTDKDAATFSFLEAAVPPVNADHRSGNLERAAAILGADPGVADANISTASVLGNAAAIERFLAEQPERVSAQDGPRNWEPLLYLCFSRFLRFEPERTDDFIAAANVLLAHGADPNAYFMSGDEKETPLYGAAGVVNNAELMRVLIAAGAEIDDPDAHYHVAEFENHECFEVFFEHGVDDKARATMLLRKLDFDDLVGVRRLLQLGCDPNQRGIWGKTALHQAIVRNRSLEFVDLLLEYGADVHAKGHERVSEEPSNAYTMAARLGRVDVCARLVAHGASTDLSPKDAFIAACARGDDIAVRDMIEKTQDLYETLNPHDRTIIVDVARDGRLDAVRAMLRAGFSADTIDINGATPMHAAAWFGHASVVELLVAHGAPLEINDHDHERTPLGWTAHGSTYCENAGGDYAATARFLLEAGARIERADMRDASEAVTEVLREFGKD